MASLSMSKLPWKGQLVVFACSARRRVGAFYYLVRVAAARGARTCGRRSWRRSGRASTRAARRRASCRSSAPQVGDLEARLESLKPILPEEKDAADLLRRVKTLAVAVEPDDSRLPAAGRSPRSETARRVADRPRARGHVSQPRRSSSIGSASSRASSTSASMAIEREGRADAAAHHRCHLHGDDLRPDRAATAARERRPSKAAPAKKTNEAPAHRAHRRRCWPSRRDGAAQAPRPAPRRAPATPRPRRRRRRHGTRRRRRPTTSYGAEGRRDPVREPQPHAAPSARGGRRRADAPTEGLAGCSCDEVVGARHRAEPAARWVAMVVGRRAADLHGSRRRSADGRHGPRRSRRRRS